MKDKAWLLGEAGLVTVICFLFLDAGMVEMLFCSGSSVGQTLVGSYAGACWKRAGFRTACPWKLWFGTPLDLAHHYQHVVRQGTSN